MKKIMALAVALGFAVTLGVAQDLVTLINGTNKKVDKSTKTIVVKNCNCSGPRTIPFLTYA